jgi:hypothetical protein
MTEQDARMAAAALIAMVEGIHLSGPTLDASARNDLVLWVIQSFVGKQGGLTCHISHEDGAQTKSFACKKAEDPCRNPNADPQQNPTPMPENPDKQGRTKAKSQPQTKQRNHSAEPDADLAIWPPLFSALVWAKLGKLALYQLGYVRVGDPHSKAI